MFGDRATAPRIVGLVKGFEEEEEEDTPQITHEGEDDHDKNKYKKKSQKLSTWYCLVLLIFCLTIYMFVVYNDNRLPEALTKSDIGANPESFIEERSRVYLKQLTSLGHRPAGSYENEILAVDFLKRELTAIQKKAKPIHKLSIDVQKPRGSFNLAFVDGVTHHYRNIQNVIAKLESDNGAKDALLINCHFDSVPGSPGASDDAVSCAIMLEILDILVQSDKPLRNNIVFLFNGAEENLLPGSHGFITQHEWASEVRAFINLEACGAGGRELVFQSGPAHPWMIQAYGRVAKHPFASVVGEEIFQSGIVPGDTDFRIFRDYGKIPGLDIAYVKNGYVYHTKYDTEEMIPPGSIQRAGDNILAIVKHLGDSEILSNTADANTGGVVFFDFIGLFLVSYPEWFGNVLNITVIIVSVSITYMKMKNSFQYGISSSVYLHQLGYTLLVQFFAMLSSFAVVTFVACLLDVLGRTMSWYSKTYLIFFLYVVPVLFAVMAVYNFALPRQKKNFQYAGGVWAIESLHFEVSKLVWTLLTLVLTLTRYRSSFLTMFWVLFPLIGRTILERSYDKSAAQKKDKDWKWVAIHCLSITFPLLMNMTTIFGSYALFIPIMGRAGSAVNPDLVIGCKTVVMTLASISYICPLFMVIRKPNVAITVLYMTMALSMIAVVVTPLGFPYSIAKGNLAPHRAFIIHTSREFRNKAGVLVEEDSGYFVINLDRNSPRALLGEVPDFYELKQVSEKECEKRLFCGMPVYYPANSMLRINGWIPAPKPRLGKSSELTLLTKEEAGPHKWRLLFRITGPDHMGVFFSPAEGVSLVNWTFEGGKILDGPVWKDERPTYFIFYSHGFSYSTWEFWIELKVPRTFLSTAKMVDIAVTGHHLHGHEMQDSTFKRFLNSFPKWSYPVGWSGTYNGYEF